MKKIWTLALSLVLTAALFTGCGCTSQRRPEMTTPTGMTEIMPTTMPTEDPTVPTTQSTRPTAAATIPTGTDAAENPTAGTTDATENTGEGRSRGILPGSENHNSSR